MTGPILLVVMIVAVAFAVALEQSMRRVKDTRRRVTQLLTKRQQQVDRLRVAGRESLTLGREVRNQQRTADVLIEEISQVDGELQRLAHPANRTFVLDEKRGGADVGWHVTVEAPMVNIGRHGPPWEGQRRFRVWAPDEHVARAKVEKRYGPEQGYSVVSVFPAPPPVANRNGDTAVA
ncbi:hypothetical protein [Niveispirillum sp. KHB5.9]|uniref:hypothetical protein n=1 Tax=Niveispirillum sp. KHB5.9 TaxID=3400269 RepID=UPI003A8A97F8